MLNHLQAFLHACGWQRPYCLAYSGGLDSQVLLWLCVQLRRHHPFALRAIHVHHGLSPHADAWLAHCRRSCEQVRVEFVCHAIHAKPPLGESLEAYARDQRYAVLKSALQPQEVLLTAHHQNDQAETMLLQLLRGAGPKGLSAMPAIKPFGVGVLARPLLPLTRAELQAYAAAQQLSWVEDEYNQDARYSRNWVRHRLLPVLQKRWPTVTQTLARAAAHCAEAQALLDSFADQDLAQVAGSQAHTLSVKRLRELTPARQRFVLRRWFESQGTLMPNAATLGQLQQAMLQARADSQPRVAWGQRELRRYRDDLYLLPLLKPPQPRRAYSWNLKEPLVIPRIGTLSASTLRGQGLQRGTQAVTVRFRQGGERYRQRSGTHHALKKFFQEQGIPPWQRDQLPLLYIGNALAAIPGYFVAEPFKAAADEAGIVVILVPPSV